MNELTQDKINQIFFYRATKRRFDFMKGSNLAYYTTAETAKKILTNCEIWMRNVSVMNDYNEVRFGCNLLDKLLYHSGDSQFIQSIKDSLDPSIFSIFGTVLKNFFDYNNGESSSWKYNTYITSFTEHKSDDNQDGRLSMWRAYGGNCGVAIIFKPGLLFEGLKLDHICLSPVEYVDENELKKEISHLIKRLEDNHDDLKDIIQTENGRKYVQNIFLWMLRLASVSLKHPGFKEESEWRLVAHGQDLEKERANFVLECVRGLEQPVYKIKLDSNPLLELIECILIGPTAGIGVRNVTQKAFVKLLTDKFKITTNEASKKVRFSSIPYRPPQ